MPYWFNIYDCHCCVYVDNSGVVLMNGVNLFEDIKESNGGIRVNLYNYISKNKGTNIVGVKDT